MSIILNGTTGITTPDVSVTAQSTAAITANRLTSDGTIIDLQKDGTTVGSIGAKSGDIYIGTGDTGIRFNDTDNAVYGADTTTGSASDGNISLGVSSARFKDLYLSGGVYVGGTGSANHLDDYEEGTWTPTLGGNPPYYTQTARYTKIGNLVYIWVNLHINVLGTGSQNRVSGLPFTPQQSNQHVGVGYFNGISQNLVSFYFSCSSLPALDPRGQTSAASGDVAVNVFQNGCQILFSGTYRVN